MRASSLILFTLALFMGLGAALLAMSWVQTHSGTPAVAEAKESISVRKVVVASQALRFGSELSPINLKEVDWPVGAAPAGAFPSMAELIKAGERRVALSAIERDEPVLAWKITGPGQRASLSAVISGDKMAMTIRVNDVSGTAGFVLPGDRVDVLLTRTEDKVGFNDVLLQNVRTLAIDQLADERSDKPSVAKAVTLEVTQGEAQRLALAERMGQLSLALRSAGATKEIASRRVSMTDLGDPEIPPPVARVVEASAPAPQPILAPADPMQVSPSRLTIVGVTRAVERKEYSVRPERN